MKQNYLHEILKLSDDQKDELAAAFEKVLSLNGWVNVEPVSYTHLTLPTNREV